ncbi:MAG: hypothetical protein QOF59_565, partial [Actinomycetota bacterium]|nr:hypothetical protein [Actinomycetota bacterium]
IALLRARADDGAAVVVVSHSSEIASASDRVIALHDGRVTV